MTLSTSQVIERADRIRALAEAGLAGREIAAQMGLHYQTIRLTCRAFGINPIKKYDGTRVQKARAQSKARAEQMIALAVTPLSQLRMRPRKIGPAPKHRAREIHTC